MDKFFSGIRVLAAAVVGWVVTLVLQYTGVVIDEETQAALVGAVATIFTAIYYVGVRWFAERFPWAEYFLGIPKSPVLVHPGRRKEAVKQVATLQTNNKNERF